MGLGLITKLAAFAAGALLATSVSAQLPPPHNAPYYDDNGILQVGTTELLNLTFHVGVNQEQLISYPDASHISVQFEDVDLPEGDVLIVRSPDGAEAHVYTGKGREDLSSFVSSPIFGSVAVVEYFANANTTAVNATTTDRAFRISGFVRGFSAELESICGKDQSTPAKCIKGTQYTRGKAVARLLIRGSALCTGWLVGNGGHLITNQHCITKASDAAQVDIEFMAESKSCSDKCAVQLGCRGTIAAKSAKFVTNDAGIDYALVRVSAKLASKYGFLQLRAAGPKTGEAIYIPQHPAGWAKRFATKVDGGGAAKITFTGKDGTPCGNDQVGYMADTQGGSSGSPVLATKDNLVVALHHCGGCANLAVDPRKIIADLKKKKIGVPKLSK